MRKYFSTCSGNGVRGTIQSARLVGIIIEDGVTYTAYESTSNAMSSIVRLERPDRRRASFRYDPGRHWRKSLKTAK